MAELILESRAATQRPERLVDAGEPILHPLWPTALRHIESITAVVHAGSLEQMRLILDHVHVVVHAVSMLGDDARRVLHSGLVKDFPTAPGLLPPGELPEPITADLEEKEVIHVTFTLDPLEIEGFAWEASVTIHINLSRGK